MTNSRLRWQCRRGMRELDVLLSRFVEQKYDALSTRQKNRFRELLTLADPELASYLLAGQLPADAELAELVRHIKGDVQAR